MIETGETFLNDAQLLRFIADKCGGETAHFLEKELECANLRAVSVGRIQTALNILSNVSFTDLEYEVEAATRILEEEVGAV